MLREILKITLVMLVAVWIFGSYQPPAPENFQTPSEIGVPTTLGVENTKPPENPTTVSKTVFDTVSHKIPTTATMTKTDPKPKPIAQEKTVVKTAEIIPTIPQIIQPPPEPPPDLNTNFCHPSRCNRPRSQENG